VHDSEHLRRRLAQRGLDRDRVERLPPLRPNDTHLGVAASRDVLEQQSEATAFTNDHAIAGLDE
jgi:hypothetical protein